MRRYDAFTVDLKDIVKWLKSLFITSVAIESTGIYWLTLYLLLEEAGIEVYLVNAKSTKNVTGRKKDDTDAIWIQKLHRCGLLQKSFQPDGQGRIVRNYVRQRKNLITIASDSVRRMQKALELMNIKVHTVISGLLAKTGMQMVISIRSCLKMIYFEPVRRRRIPALVFHSVFVAACPPTGGSQSLHHLYKWRLLSYTKSVKLNLNSF